MCRHAFGSRRFCFARADVRSFSGSNQVQITAGHHFGFGLANNDPKARIFRFDFVIRDNGRSDFGASLKAARVIREVQLGKVRREAIKDMAERLGIAEMTSFVAAIIQSEQLGVSMAKVLRIQSDQMRVKRRQRAEEEAHKAPVKMIIPMALLIFPSIMIIILTPAAIQIMESL